MNTGKPFSFCLNTSTIRGQGLDLPEEIQVIAQAGYDGIEPWVREIDAFVISGGSLVDLNQLITDVGLTVPNIIGFYTWAVDDDQERAAGLEEARRNMEICAALGCRFIAAPPFGVTKVVVPVQALAERYHVLLDLGRQMGVIPMLEFWGVSQTLQRLSDSIKVATQVGQKDACILADVFHMAKGGSAFEDLRHIEPGLIQLMHLNDYPEGILTSFTDADRVYPGDGTAPLDFILSSLYGAGYRGALSVELFNTEYWQQDALHVAQTALRKARIAVNHALNSA